MNKKLYIRLFALIIAALCVTSCSNKTKKSLGLVETLPDEYQVSRSEGLEIPPHYKLNKPK